MDNKTLFTLISMLKFAEHFFIINSFRCNSNKQFYLFPEEFHTDKEEIDFRTSVSTILLIFIQYSEASRRAAIEQKGSFLEAFIKFMLTYSLIPELRNWDPVALDNMVPIGNNQYDQVGLTSDH
jgi:hypothetical protein